MNNYIKQQEQIERHFEQLPVFSSPIWYRRYACFTANIGRFMPERPVAEHIDLFKKTLINQHLSFLDQEHRLKLKVHWPAEGRSMLEILRKEPGIICTFHTGSYRLLNYELMQNGIPFALVLASDVLKQQGACFQEEYKRSSNQEMSLIDAEHPTALLKLMRCLQQGKSLLAYMDGNTGTRTRAVKLLEIPFFAGRMRVRQGLPWLAKKAAVPIYNVICTRKAAGELCFHLGPSLQSDLRVPAEEFAARATQHMYTEMGKRIADKPWQWENWLVLHRGDAYLQDG